MSQYVNITARRIAEPVQGENCVLKGCGLFSQILEAGKSQSEQKYSHLTFSSSHRAVLQFHHNSKLYNSHNVIKTSASYYTIFGHYEPALQ